MACAYCGRSSPLAWMPLGHDTMHGSVRAAPVGLALPAPEGRIAGVGPAPGVVVVGLDAAQLIEHLEVIFQRFLDIVEKEHLVERADRPAFGAGAVVGDDHDQGVVQLADLFQELKDAPEVMVGEADEAGIDFHKAGIQPPGRRRAACPKRAHPDRAPTAPSRAE